MSNETTVTANACHEKTQIEEPGVPVYIKSSTTKPILTPTLNPELVSVCSCEATGRPDNDPTLHHYEPGSTSTLLIGRVNPADRGMCQINMDAHGGTTKQIGMDILNNYSDYVAYANHLHERFGLQPWTYSQHCWDNI